MTRLRRIIHAIHTLLSVSVLLAAGLTFGLTAGAADTGRHVNQLLSVSGDARQISLLCRDTVIQPQWEHWTTGLAQEQTEMVVVDLPHTAWQENKLLPWINALRDNNPQIRKFILMPVGADTLRLVVEVAHPQYPAFTLTPALEQPQPNQVLLTLWQAASEQPDTSSLSEEIAGLKAELDAARKENAALRAQLPGTTKPAQATPPQAAKTVQALQQENAQLKAHLSSLLAENMALQEKLYALKNIPGLIEKEALP
ncbi:MAG: hypothetical protein AB7P76_04515 [Candidatus Melainabacteria bacterium]